ncbi:hypothetical protein RD792_015707 [Penstemon davidsonii]|uniref:Alpha/beta hydrolase fold-3 domain-containing protein n=1 Tax=Penstemon davidsonii TaxID=160366 RepID=A0ABR0CHF1_9LAMI|nr:hypothetical protein RD792_015707 [Penstemon davidsonii]
MQNTPYAFSNCVVTAHIPAFIASVDYRLAPEHRLPAAYNDGMDAVVWAKTQALSSSSSLEHVDFSRVFLMGTSCGGNIVYHVGLRALDLDLQPLKIVRLIMNQPPFGGLTWSQSELKNINDPVTLLHVADLIWSLALPNGAYKDHEYCNPWAWASGSHSKKNIIGRLQACMVRAYGGDPLIDRHKEFVEMLKACGVRVLPRFLNGGYHSAELFEPSFVQPMYDDIRYFINFFVQGLPLPKL